MPRRLSPVLAVSLLSAAALAAAAGLPTTAHAQTATRGTPAEAAHAVTGTIDAVTVYRGQALVTRSIPVPPGTGLIEIVVGDLPQAILPGSLYAESADGVEVRSVSYRVRPVVEDVRENVRTAEKAVRDARDALDAAKARAQYFEWQRQYLDKLEGFVAPTAQAELTSGVLDADTLTKLTEEISSRRKAQADEGHRLAIETRDLAETLQLRERELSVLSASSSRTAREAVVFVNAARPGATVRLSYLVSGANWAPSYNLRIADVSSGKAAVEYQASVQQMSGEDWGDVSLTLSTATPALVATGPSLEPLTVALGSPQQLDQSLAMFKDKSYAEAKRVIVENQREQERTRVNFIAADQLGRGGGGPTGQPHAQTGAFAMQIAGDANRAVVLSLDAGLNDIADCSEMLDLISNERVDRKTKSEAVTLRQGDEGLSVTYRIPSRTSMPSRADQQLIQIARLDLDSSVFKSAVPGLTQYVYHEAELKNTSSLVLLAGPAASYLAGEFVGSSGVPTVAAGQTFRAGFGIDSSLRCSKELIERKEDVKAGNRIIEFTYRLTVENFGSGPAEVRLLDRMPSPVSDITVAMHRSQPPVSADKAYLDTDAKKNLLRWDVAVPPGSGTGALAVEYTFRLEFAKDMTLIEGK